MPDAQVTRILQAAGDGGEDGRRAADELLPLVYQQLRAIAQQRMAGERKDHTLRATALVHEAYLKLVGDGGQVEWSGRAAFFRAAAEAMRRILVDHARAKGRIKRGGGQAPLTGMALDSIGSVADLAKSDRADEIVAFESAFRRLEEHDPRFAEVVRLRFFAGLSVEHTAMALGVSERTVNSHWTYARAWLARELSKPL
ncbi:MAG: ECF-type sigma factor [Phycisphaerales bacterium]|nr:ECF-type sigma factor [Phycisphaerales bacterium]MCI0677308.1 ECF-type sigma factor [Phycisphaerales bacterium]